MKLIKCKMKILCTETNFVRYRECNLIEEQFNKMKERVNKSTKNINTEKCGNFVLMDIWKI